MKNKVKKIIIPEKEEQKLCLQICNFHGVIAWRINSGAMSKSYEDKYGIKKFRYIKFGFPGIPDLLGFIPGSPNLTSRAIPFFWEVKREGAKPTENQKNFLEMASATGCFAGFGTSKKLTVELSKYLKNL